MPSIETAPPPFVTCRECDKEFPRKSPRCTACGAANRPPKREPGAEMDCYQCGTRLPRKSNVCTACGYPH